MEKLYRKLTALNMYGTDLTELAKQVIYLNFLRNTLSVAPICLYWVWARRLGKYGKFCFKASNLVSLFQNKLNPVIGRTDEIERVMQILCKRGNNNVCLTGNPGVGKTVIVEGLASRIVNGTVPLKLQGTKV